MRRLRPSERVVLAAQSAYFLVTGLWPLLHYASFELVSGRKRDDWLVKTLGALLLPVAAALALGARRPRSSREVRTIAAGSAVALATCDAVFVAQGRIRRVYLLDAVIEVALVLGLLAARRRADDEA